MQAETKSGKYLTFQLADEDYGIALLQIKEIIGMMPITGIPLPLISYGGTSIVTLLAGFGILMSIYGHRNFIR